MSFVSGVPARPLVQDPPRSLTSYAIAAVAALLAATSAHSLAGAPTSSADTSATVEVETQRMSDASLTSRPDGTYTAGEHVTLVCSTRGPAPAALVNTAVAGRGNDLWYRTSDGYYVADADIDTGTVKVAAPECTSQPASIPTEAVLADAPRTEGQTQSVNPGTPGQCTWGAAQKWFEASGSYPVMLGNALAWGDSAKAAGWTVVDDARPRSIVVFQPGVAGAGSIGHVAWVNSVSQRPDGTWLQVTEMNNTSLGGPGVFNDREVRQVPGMAYVLLP